MCNCRDVRVWFPCHFTVPILFLRSEICFILFVLREAETESMIKGFPAELRRALIEPFPGSLRSLMFVACPLISSAKLELLRFDETFTGLPERTCHLHA